MENAGNMENRYILKSKHWKFICSEICHSLATKKTKWDNLKFLFQLLTANVDPEVCLLLKKIGKLSDLIIRGVNKEEGSNGGNFPPPPPPF